MKKLALTLTIALALGTMVLSASAQTQRSGAAALHAQAQNYTPKIEQVLVVDLALGAGRVGPTTAAEVPMAAPTVGAIPAGKHRDQAAAIIRKHEEPPQGGSFIFVHLRMSACGTKRRFGTDAILSAFGRRSDMSPGASIGRE